MVTPNKKMLLVIVAFQCDFMAFKKLFNEFGGICIKRDEDKISEGLKSKSLSK